MMMTTHEIFSKLTAPVTDHPTSLNEVFAILRERCIEIGLIDPDTGSDSQDMVAAEDEIDALPPSMTVGQNEAPPPSESPPAPQVEPESPPPTPSIAPTGNEGHDA